MPNLSGKTASVRMPDHNHCQNNPNKSAIALSASPFFQTAQNGIGQWDVAFEEERSHFFSARAIACVTSAIQYFGLTYTLPNPGFITAIALATLKRDRCQAKSNWINTSKDDVFIVLRCYFFFELFASRKCRHSSGWNRDFLFSFWIQPFTFGAFASLE